MKLLEMSDIEILKVAEPMLQDIVAGNNARDWALFSKHMPEADAADPKIRKDIERQWEECEWLTALAPTAEFLGVIRKPEEVVVLWRQTSPKSDEEFLEKLTLIEVDGKVLQDGIWLE